MIRSTPIESATVRDLLFGDAAGTSTDVLAESLHEHGTVGAWARPGLTATAEHQIAGATDELLSLNLADVAAQGWKKYVALDKAARSTVDSPATEVVTLLRHSIVSSHHPTVDVTFDGTPVATINIDLELTFTIAGAKAVIRRGRLMEIRIGTCTVAGSLAVQQVSVVKRQHEFVLPGIIRFGEGIPLASAPARPASLV